MDGDPQHNEAGGLNKADGSKNKCSGIGIADNMLMEELKAFNLEILYVKFHEAAVTSDIVWDLDDDILHECNLTKVEILRYQKAVKKFPSS